MRIYLHLYFLLFPFIFFSQTILEEKTNNVSSYYDFSSSLQAANEPITLSGLKPFDYHSGIKKPFLFNGNFNFPYCVASKKLMFGKKKNFFQCIQFVPEIKIRIFQNDTSFNDKSKPVRTPSYIPKISYLVTHKKFWDDKKQFNFYLGLSALHHSNGQGGWEFNYTDSIVNIFDGSFSESLYFQLFTGGKVKLKMKVNSEGQEKKVNKQSFLLWKTGFEWHPVYFSNQKFHQTGLYGGNRIFLQTLFRQIKLKRDTNFHESFRIHLHVEYITDLSYYEGTLKSSRKIDFLKAKKRLNVSLTFYKQLFTSSNMALFAQVGYFGSDNYNIYFQQSMFIARWGLSFGIFN